MAEHNVKQYTIALIIVLNLSHLEITFILVSIYLMFSSHISFKQNLINHEFILKYDAHTYNSQWLQTVIKLSQKLNENDL